MLDGVEWNVRLSSVATPALLQKFGATFDSRAELEFTRDARDYLWKWPSASKWFWKFRNPSS